MLHVLKVTVLNGICPYYTMYPLDFPLHVLGKRVTSEEWVLDPFCGRGTTNFAARLLGLPTVGLDTRACLQSLYNPYPEDSRCDQPHGFEIGCALLVARRQS